jgi:hypothetical protein
VTRIAVLNKATILEQLDLLNINGAQPFHTSRTRRNTSRRSIPLRADVLFAVKRAFADLRFREGSFPGKELVGEA